MEVENNVNLAEESVSKTYENLNVNNNKVLPYAEEFIRDKVVDSLSNNISLNNHVLVAMMTELSSLLSASTLDKFEGETPELKTLMYIITKYKLNKVEEVKECVKLDKNTSKKTFAKMREFNKLLE